MLITREETIERLAVVNLEIQRLREALAQPWGDVVPSWSATQVFLNKCGGWEDDRSPDAVVAELYAARTASGSGRSLNGDPA
jgi:hypothetical protein